MAEQVNIVVAVTLFAIYCNLINSADQTTAKLISNTRTYTYTRTHIHISIYLHLWKDICLHAEMVSGNHCYPSKLSKIARKGA